jgi:hypothetical protein
MIPLIAIPPQEPVAIPPQEPEQLPETLAATATSPADTQTDQPTSRPRHTNKPIQHEPATQYERGHPHTNPADLNMNPLGSSTQTGGHAHIPCGNLLTEVQPSCEYSTT